MRYNKVLNYNLDDFFTAQQQQQQPAAAAAQCQVDVRRRLAGGERRLATLRFFYSNTFKSLSFYF
jgi:hypothetical protein